MTSSPETDPQSAYENPAPLDLEAAARKIQSDIDTAAAHAYAENEDRYQMALAAIDRALDQTPGSDTASGKVTLERRAITEAELREDRMPLASGEAIRLRPAHVRSDDKTGAPVIPLLIVRGMGANEALPWYMKEAALAEQREVVAVMYHGRLKGSTAPDPAYEGASRIDVAQADDLIAALETLGIHQADLLAESRGGIRAVVAMLKAPDKFRHALLKDIPIDERTYLQRHADAARESWARVRREDGPSNRPPSGLSKQDRSGPLTRLINTRIQQRSVARARLGRLLGRLSPSVSAVVSYDEHDKAFTPNRVEQIASELAAKDNVSFMKTHRGGHGFRYDVDSVRESLSTLRQLERTR